MRMLYKYMCVVAVAVQLAACDFLDREPHIIDADGYYTSEAKVRQGLAGIYGVMSAYEFYGGQYSIMASGVDDHTYLNAYNDSSSRLERYNFSASSDEVYRIWSKIYEGVKNANEFLTALDSPTFNRAFDPSGHYYAEARFLRAYYHFLLAQAWGDVPLRTVAVSSNNPEDLKLAATPQAQVLRWCVEEMEATLDEEAARGLSSRMADAPSRVVRTTAQGILARVYLFLAGESVARKVEAGLADSRPLYARAAYWARRVIDSGEHRLNPSYEQLFINMIGDKYDRAANESMWEVEFLGDRSSADKWSNGRIGDLNGLKSQSSKYNYSEWACNYSYGQYNGNYTLWRLYREADLTTGDRPLSDADPSRDVRQVWNLPSYNFQGVDRRSMQCTDRVTGAKLTRTITLHASMARTPYTTSTSATMRAEELVGLDATAADAIDPTRHTYIYDVAVAAGVRNTGKFRREVAYEGQMRSKSLYTGINFPILRYADVLLMYAEAQLEAEGTPDALARDCVRQVRERAGVTMPAVGDGDVFRALVRNERGRELAFEGLRKYDLIRWGLFVEAMHGAAALPPEAKHQNPTINNYAAANYRNVQPKHIFMPVPSRELSGNSLMKQNTMW